MTPIEMSHPTSAVAARLDALGADCEIAGCPECGCVLLDGSACDCTALHSGAGQPRRDLAEVLDGDLVALQASALWRLQLRGEVIA